MKPYLVAALAVAVVVAGAVIGLGNLARSPAANVVADGGGAGLVATAAAAERSVTLQVDGMTCPSCPYIVSRTLERTPGVLAATVSFADKTAVVTYDATKTGIAQLVAATTEMGYPSRLARE